LSGASIYLLRCADGSYYTGITRRSVEERVSEHAQGLIAGYTFTRRPVSLVFSELYERIDEAVAAERRIKGWSRAKKEAYMRGDFARLVALATRGSKRGRLSRQRNRQRLLERPSRPLAAQEAPQDEGGGCGAGKRRPMCGAISCG
jgi:putative endonuclease